MGRKQTGQVASLQALGTVTAAACYLYPLVAAQAEKKPWWRFWR